MPSTADPQLYVHFEAQERTTDRVTSYRIDSDYLTSTDGFEFTLYDPDRSKVLGLALQPVELIMSASRVSDAQQVLGRIDVTEVGGTGSAVTCRGRDYIADLVECMIDPTVKVTKNASIAQVFSDAMAPCGITEIVGGGDVLLRNIRTGKSPTNPKGPTDLASIKLDAIKPQPGQGVYDFCNRLAARNGVTIQPMNVRSAVCLSQPDYQQAPQYEIRRSTDSTAGRANNVVSARAVEDYSSFPTFVLGTGKSPSGKAAGKLNREYDIQTVADEVLESVANRLSGRIIRGRVKPQDASEADGRLYRLLYHNDDEVRNVDQLDRVCTRRFSELLKATLSYSVTLNGHEDPDSGALYGVNTVIDVKDEITGVNEPLWIARRTFTYADGAGAQTELECWRLGSLQL